MLLNAVRTLGPVSLKRLLQHFDDDVFAILEASPSRLKAVPGIGEKLACKIHQWEETLDLGREKARLEKMGGTFLIQEDEDYPSLLKNLYDAPIGLYKFGKMPLKGPAVAIIGTRRASLYGKSVARRLAADLAGAGILVVSGFARGIDTEAHMGALEVEGPTVAVMGCGADIIYPPENTGLYRQLVAGGAILSEFPLGRSADRQTFPQRNRIVSGMVDAVVVVETPEAGGSLITARFAAEQGRQVYAVPGRIDQEQAGGCHSLIRDGATLVTCASQILEDLQQPQFGFAAEMAKARNRQTAEAAGLENLSEAAYR